MNYNMRSEHMQKFFRFLMYFSIYNLPFCECEFVDLTHPFDDSTFFWSTAKPLRITTTFNGTVPGKGHWFHTEGICAGTTHSGTHMDAPCHVTKGGWSISDIPLRHLVVEAVVVDIREEVGENRDVHLTVDHLLKWEAENGRIPDGSLLLVCTGWSRFWPDRLRYLGTEGFNTHHMRFPSITGSASRWLRRHRHLVGVGIDSITIDVNNDKEESHLALLGGNIYALENLANLHLLPATGSRVYVLPTLLKGASGAPCRVVAEIP